MNSVSRILSNLLATAIGVALWVAAGLAAFTVTSVLLLGLAVAGLWAMLTGRKAWWAQLRQVHTQARQAQGMWRGRSAGQSAHADASGQAAHVDQTPEAVDPRGQRTPLAERRFGRAGRLGVTDVQAREAH